MWQGIGGGCQTSSCASHLWCCRALLLLLQEGRAEKGVGEEGVHAEGGAAAAEVIEDAAAARLLLERRPEEGAAEHVVHHVLEGVLRPSAEPPAAAEHGCQLPQAPSALHLTRASPMRPTCDDAAATDGPWM
jgi:hypothetical protein